MRRKNMSKVQVMDHPLIQHKINCIRKEDVGTKEFRQIVSEIAALMCFEATRDLKLQDVKIKTPICEMVGKELSGKKLAVVPILRAGLGMVDGMLSMIPTAKVGHIGLYRDPDTYEPVEYYCKLPADCDEREVFVVDPMLATGGSSVAAIQMLKDLKKEFWSNVFIPGNADNLNTELEKALRVADFIEIGTLMAHDALDRAESCGGHFRTEHQTEEGEALRHDDKFMYVSCWEYQGEDKDPVMLKEDLNYEFVVPQTRNYKK